MQNRTTDRRNFIGAAARAGIGVALSAGTLPAMANIIAGGAIRTGIIGLDTEHSVAFTRIFHAAEAPPDVAGFRVVEIATFFRTGQPPVSPEETAELFAFMEAADRSKHNDGAPASLQQVKELI